MRKIERALISVSNKQGIVEFARGLRALGIQILSTGGTAKTLRDAGIDIKDVSEYTGFPELLHGRLKTLHPKIHGGLLWRRDNPEDEKEIKAHAIGSIDLVVVNLYPFEETVSKTDVTFDEAIENIDIGGPTMLRAASKNFRDVTVIVDPEDYTSVLKEIKNSQGGVSYQTKFYLAQKVFEHTARYDTLIANYLKGIGTQASQGFPEYLNQSFTKVSDLRYGENPHQRAAIYREPLYKGLSIVDARLLQGKEMSYNNYLDANSALELVREFKEAAAVIIKHNNPCGVAIADNLLDAYKKAYKVDPLSAFGGVIALNREVDGETAQEIITLFVELVLAPNFSRESLEIFKKKPNIRLLELDLNKKPDGFDMRRILGGVLAQEKDLIMVEDFKALKVVTKRRPAGEELSALSFAWKVSKHVKSNAIVYATKDQVLGIGVGQTSRVDSAKTGAMKALSSLKGAVVASDGFFPHRDGIDAIAKLGITAVIQPGGSIKDDDVIAAADEHNMSMIFTGIRHFKH
ncbi:MAG: bifunctional phosphoribosylaminoimidazolecarboxamide formyltransferase/IMP cyclohydrolase [Nitrospirae bacterium]|nr:bifunctional phosphoribosylaminoimidazolecarboxamide formyltransferase/IMP cyclohydrolase [Nitrospirota bacterium]